eukprot:scaffold13528_cov169-Amphora_coffeaeformis.AAC.2
MAHHPGNRHFRRMIENFAGAYYEVADSMRERTLIYKRVINGVQQCVGRASCDNATTGGGSYSTSLKCAIKSDTPFGLQPDKETEMTWNRAVVSAAKRRISKISKELFLKPYT